MDSLFAAAVSDVFAPQQVVLDAASQHSATELDAIRTAIARPDFAPAQYPKLRVAQSGVAYCRALSERGSFLKLLMIDHEDWQTQHQQPEIANAIDRLANHLHGSPNAPGFMAVRPQLSSNRDGHQTAFTTGLTLNNQWLVAPVAHSLDAAVAPWIQEFHVRLGEVNGQVMHYAMSTGYQEFAAARRLTLDVPCYGANLRTQNHFTSAQINCSTVRQQMAGTAGGVHQDGQDCILSHSMAINCLLVRPSTQLGYFWLPTLDLLVPVRPRQILIFQGNEEHTGTPFHVDPHDPSPLPTGQSEEIRFNIISYPKHAILNRRAPYNFNGHVRNQPNHAPTLLKDALPSLGRKRNYRLWKHLTMSRRLQTAHYHFSGQSLPLSKVAGVLVPHAVLATLAIDESMEAMDTRIRRLQPLVRKQIQRHFTHPARATSVAPASPTPGLPPASRLQLLEIFAYNEADQAEEEPLIPTAPPTPHPVMPAEAVMEPENWFGPDPDFLLGLVPEMPVDLASPMEVSVANPAVAPMTPIVPAPPPPPSAVDILRQIWVPADLEQELEEVAGGLRRAITRPMHGLSALVSVLPTSTQMGQIEASMIADTCLHFGHAISGFTSHIESSQVATRILQGSTMRLALQILRQFETASFDIWDVSERQIPDQSISVQLRQQILTQWLESPRTVLIFEAATILGDHYQPTQHDDVHLSVRAGQQERGRGARRTMSTILRQVLWGMIFYRPLLRLINTYHLCQLRDVAGPFRDRVGSAKHTGQQHIFGRLHLYDAVVAHLGQETLAEDQPAWHVNSGAARVAFSPLYPASTVVSEDRRQEILDALDDPQLGPLRGTLDTLTGAYVRHYDLNLFVRQQGQSALPHLHAVGEPMPPPPPTSRRAAPGRVRKRSPTRRNTIGGARASMPPQEEMMELVPPGLDVVDEPTWDPLEQGLLQYLRHAVRVAHTIVQCQQEPSRTPGHDVRWLSHPHPATRAFIQQACQRPASGDKYTGFRRQGPSWKVMHDHWDPTQVVLGVQRLLVIRLVGMGQLPLIAQLSACVDVDAMTATLEAHLQSWGNSGIYGMLVIPTSRVVEVARRAWEEGGAAWATWWAEHGATGSFAELQAMWGRLQLPYLNAGGLLIWLVGCDLADLQLGQPPTALDLARKIYSGGGSGPRQAVERIAYKVDRAWAHKPPTVLAERLTRVLGRLNEVEPETGGAPLHMGDVEHLLCKLTREAKLIRRHPAV
ncbi:MAG: hypothetical protein M1837_002243 [Sclerophora amabilis]|nr:MAG: hypothetical protein M1837_002243 [Sclerophora amabilis]